MLLHCYCNKCYTNVLFKFFRTGFSSGLYLFAETMPPKRKSDSENNKSSKKKPNNSHWALGLLDSMNDPELQVDTDDKVVVIKDKYPKAKHHYLVLPKEDISDLKNLKREHVPLLKHMEDMGQKVIEKMNDGTSFKIGYHARASMQRLHLHVISTDMNSPCLKTKKHWITFTTGFFLEAESNYL